MKTPVGQKISLAWFWFEAQAGFLIWRFFSNFLGGNTDGRSLRGWAAVRFSFLSAAGAADCFFRAPKGGESARRGVSDPAYGVAVAAFPAAAAT